MFRGGGKTSIFSCSTLHATGYKFRRFVVTISATNRESLRVLRQIKAQLWTNKPFAEDFPEICYPFMRIENNGRRCKGQLWLGEPTQIQWDPDQVVFASIPPRPDPAVIVCRAMGGAIKGLNYLAPDGTLFRPDLVLLDDPQTRKTAKSVTATEDLIQTIDGDVLGLAGHEEPITAVMAITPIFEGDLACTYLSRDEKPEWQGETAPMVYRMPDALDTLWDQYRQIGDDAAEKRRRQESGHEVLPGTPGGDGRRRSAGLAGRPDVQAGIRPSVRDGPLLSIPPGLLCGIPVPPAEHHSCPRHDADGRRDRPQDERPARRHGPNLGRMADGLCRRRQELPVLQGLRLGQGFYRLRDRIRHVPRTAPPLLHQG